MKSYIDRALLLNDFGRLMRLRYACFLVLTRLRHRKVSDTFGFDGNPPINRVAMRIRNALQFFTLLLWASSVGLTAEVVPTKAAQSVVPVPAYFLGVIANMKGHPDLPVVQVGNTGPPEDTLKVITEKDWFPAKDYFGTGMDQIRFMCPPLPAHRLAPKLLVPNQTQSDGGARFQLEFPCWASASLVRKTLQQAQDILLMSKNPEALECSDPKDKKACDTWKKYIEALLMGSLMSAPTTELCGLVLELGVRDYGIKKVLAGKEPESTDSDCLKCVDEEFPVEGWKPDATPEEQKLAMIKSSQANMKGAAKFREILAKKRILLRGDGNTVVRGRQFKTSKLISNITAVRFGA